MEKDSRKRSHYSSITIVQVAPEDIATSSQRRRAFEDLGCRVIPLYISRLSERPSYLTRAIRLCWRRLGRPLERNHENSALVNAVEKYRPDIVFVEKGLTIRLHTLKTIRSLHPETRLVCYSLDDMMNPGNQSKYYLQSIPIYDVHFTSKNYNLSELLELGAKRVERTGNAYSPHVHRPIELTEDDKIRFGADVSFVGGYEADRAEVLNQLAGRGIFVRVWGNNWDKFDRPHPDLRLEMGPAYGEDYAKVVCSSKILLGFLRKINRDVETTRTVEIPAFGGFLLGERTEAQQALFHEGLHAEYFDSTEELVEKIEYYLKHEEIRKRIAAAGRRHCIDRGYSYDIEMAKVIDMALDL